MRTVVDTGVFSAALSRRRRPAFDRHVQFLVGQQLFLASVSVAELRFGALVAELRYACRKVGHPLGDRSHGNDLLSPLQRFRSAPCS